MIGFLALTLFGEKMGRKRLMLSNLFVSIVGLAITMNSWSLSVAVMGFFLTLFGTRNNFNICFYFIAEIMED